MSTVCRVSESCRLYLLSLFVARTARVVSKYRPNCPIISVTRDAKTARQVGTSLSEHRRSFWLLLLLDRLQRKASEGPCLVPDTCLCMREKIFTGVLLVQMIEPSCLA